MKSKSVSLLPLFLLLVVGSTHAQLQVKGRAVVLRDSSSASCAVGDFGLKCNSCSSALFCSGGNSLGTINCPATNSFCDSATNSCTNNRPLSCGTSFKCPAEGYFPDPDRCNLYYFCTSSLVPQLYECPSNYVFDYATSGCKRQIFHWDCVTMKCTTANDFIVYPKDASIYAFCDANKSPILLKCPGSLTFDKAIYGCKFVCKSEGYFAGATAQQAYFCYRQGLNLQYTMRFCPSGYEFNAKFACVRSATTTTVPSTSSSTESPTTTAPPATTSTETTTQEITSSSSSTTSGDTTTTPEATTAEETTTTEATTTQLSEGQENLP